MRTKLNMQKLTTFPRIIPTQLTSLVKEVAREVEAATGVSLTLRRKVSQPQNVMKQQNDFNKNRETKRPPKRTFYFTD